MKSTPRQTALTIWRTGVDAVRAETLVRKHVTLNENELVVCDQPHPLSQGRRVCVVGAGKAAGYLATELEHTLGPVAEEIGLHGWINVPENCVENTEFIRQHAARPAFINEPRPEGVEGTWRIIELVSNLQPQDLCVCLLTGGGSALLPAPRSGTTLEDKQLVTSILSSHGANIRQLNRVRTAMSDVKGGGLKRACTADRLVTLIVSDVIGDPIECIASGPTVDVGYDAQEVTSILRQFDNKGQLPERIWQYFAGLEESGAAASSSDVCVTHHILANNQTAVDAAAQEATAQGYRVVRLEPEPPHCRAEEVADKLVKCISQAGAQPTCILWGGEPVVDLAPDADRGKGGRNQQLVLSALAVWPNLPAELRQRLCILSGGTDGEDGPTDAAGAFADEEIWQSSKRMQLDPQPYLHRNDAYSFFATTNGLIKTGPTHTTSARYRPTRTCEGTGFRRRTSPRGSPASVCPR